MKWNENDSSRVWMNSSRLVGKKLMNFKNSLKIYETATSMSLIKNVARICSKIIF